MLILWILIIFWYSILHYDIFNAFRPELGLNLFNRLKYYLGYLSFGNLFFIGLIFKCFGFENISRWFYLSWSCFIRFYLFTRKVIFLCDVQLKASVLCRINIIVNWYIIYWYIAFLDRFRTFNNLAPNLLLFIFKLKLFKAF